jgi:hypothetical protein
MRWLSISVLLSSLGMCALAAAQDTDLPPAPPPPPAAGAATPAPAPAQATPPPPPTYQTAPAPAAAAPTAPAEPAPPAGSCEPACRAGFSCVNSQCISSCNPPCGSGQTCTAEGQCISAHPGAPPGRFFANGVGDTPIKDPTAERHDGFMLRLTLGFGGGTVTRHIKNDPAEILGGDGKTTVSGFGESFSLDIGGAPMDNLIIHGRLSTFGLINPKIKRHGDELDANDDDGGASILIGPAITYYFMPINIYLTGAIGLGVVGATVKDEDDKAHGTGGVAFDVDVGKEWWAGDQWGLGAAARLSFAAGSRKDNGIELEYNMLAFAIVFSATYQ